MIKLTERSLVKDLAAIARADTLHDGTLDTLIAQQTAEVEKYCRRSFGKAARTEFYRSYDQYIDDPSNQYLWLDGPVDTLAAFSVTWALPGEHDTRGRELTAEHYQLDAEKGLVTVLGGRGGNQFSALPFMPGTALYGASPTGFRVIYTGGYTVTAAPLNHIPDPIDDFGVAQVPDGLKLIVAQKVAKDWKEGLSMKPWTDEDKARLNPYRKEDRV